MATKVKDFNVVAGTSRTAVVILLGAKGTDGDTYMIEVDPITAAIPIAGTFSLGGEPRDFGASAPALRTASLLGNSTGQIDYASGASSAQTVRVVLATRHEAVATPLSVRLSDGAAFYAGPTTAQFPTTIGQTTSAASLSVVLASDATSSAPAGYNNSKLITRDYSGSNVTNAYTNLGTPVAFDAQAIEIFETGGSALIIGIGGVDKFYVYPGGNDARIPFKVPNGSQLQIKTVTGTVSAGSMFMNIYG